MGSALAEGAIHLIGEWFRQIGSDRSFLGRNKHLRRHAGHQLHSIQLNYGVLGREQIDVCDVVLLAVVAGSRAEAGETMATLAFISGVVVRLNAVRRTRADCPSLTWSMSAGEILISNLSSAFWGTIVAIFAAGVMTPPTVCTNSSLT